MTMKRSKKLICVILSFVLLFSCTSATSFAADPDMKTQISQTFSRTVTKAFAVIINGLLGAVNLPVLDNPAFVKEEDYVNENFYAGNETFADSAADGGVWKLGSAWVSLLPDDYLTKNYYLGGFIMIENGFVNKVEDVADDMRARVIAIDDNSGRGVSLFATIDCIGITNNDIKEIRKLVARTFAEKYPDETIASINVFSTHTHSGIDTEGLWTNTLPKALKNLMVRPFGGEMEQGTDKAFMDALYTKVAGAMEEAYNNMKPGTMTYAVKDIGPDYFSNKNRSQASDIDTRLTRLMFTPTDGSTPTVIVNLGAHPDVAGLPLNDGINKGRTVSGDYVYYIGEYLNNCGYDFMFFNGAICGIYIGRGPTNDSQNMTYRWEQSRRYGYEIAKMTLGMTRTEEEIKADPDLYDQALIDREMAEAEANGGGYSLWCENWEPVTETPVEPFFNVRIATVSVPVTNNLIKLAGKLNLANYTVLKSGPLQYKVNVEIGYLEFGRQLKVCMVPGEMCADLIKGGTSTKADYAISGKDFEAPVLTEIFGDVTVFGLANDAVGYIVPDNDYSMGLIYDHYQELLSLGENTASCIMNGFKAMAEELGR
jgi:hypothetical protein